MHREAQQYQYWLTSNQILDHLSKPIFLVFHFFGNMRKKNILSQKKNASLHKPIKSKGLRLHFYAEV